MIMKNKICIVPEVNDAKGYLALKYVSKLASNYFSGSNPTTLDWILRLRSLG